MSKDIEMSNIMPYHKIQALNLKELAVARQADNLKGLGVEPMLDAGYVVGLVEKLESKLNEVIERVNFVTDGGGLQDVEDKVNEVIRALNRHHLNLSTDMQKLNRGKTDV